jgi:hypothetical protein
LSRTAFKQRYEHDLVGAEPVPTVFLDLNFLILNHERGERHTAALRCRFGEHSLTPVVSPWHWVEISRDANLARSVALARFTDSLEPSWLQERRHLQKLEVQTRFFADMGVHVAPVAALGSRAAAIRSIIGDAEHADRVDSAAFVRYLRTQEGREPLVTAFREQFAAQQGLRALYRRGQYTRAIRRQSKHRLIEQYLPETTPDGQRIDRQTRRAFVAAVTISDFPTLAVEHSLSEDAIQLDRAVTENEFSDRQHALAIPYVDFFVTDDRRLRNTIERITPIFPFVTARCLSLHQFDTQFPQR